MMAQMKASTMLVKKLHRGQKVCFFQVTLLTGRIDAAESELRSTRLLGGSEYDVTGEGGSVHQMASQLLLEKEALQARISQQLLQIESLNGEVRQLRSEVADLTRQVNPEEDENGKESPEAFKEGMAGGGSSRNPRWS